MNVYPKQAIKGKDYTGTIEIATDMIDKQVLPKTLDKVTSGNKELKLDNNDYTYTLKGDNLSADFKIPAANVVGDIQIQLTLVDKPIPTIKHKLTFTGTNCDLYLDAEGKTKYTETDFEAGYSFSGYIIPGDKDHTLPTDVTFTSGGQPYEAETAKYNAETGALSVKMSADIEVIAVSNPKKWYEYDDWYTKTDKATTDDIGATAKITLAINNENIVHRVRLIDIDKDILSPTNGTAHTTWEFANVITSSESDIKVSFGESNEDYKDSNINTYLNDTNIGVIAMFPTELQNVIVSVEKKCLVMDSGYYDLSTKLFLPSLSELDKTYPIKNEGEVYAFYNTDENRHVKEKVNGEAVPYWTRSTFNSDPAFAWYVPSDGVIDWDMESSSTLKTDQYHIAPAFCI